jgi:transcriptional regulator with XRE-family HTH domain
MGVIETSRETVTLSDFATRVGCHFSTVSRLKSGDRLPGRELLGRIVREYRLNPEKALDAYVSGRSAFGAFLRYNVFEQDKEIHVDSTPPGPTPINVHQPARVPDQRIAV